MAQGFQYAPMQRYFLGSQEEPQSEYNSERGLRKHCCQHSWQGQVICYAGMVTDGLPAGSGHLAPVSEGVEGRPARHTLRDPQDASKDSAAAGSSSQAGAPAQAPRDSGEAATGKSQTGIPSDTVDKPTASTSRSVQTSIPQSAPRDAAAIPSGSQTGKEQDLLRGAASGGSGPQTGSAQVESADARSAVSKPAQDASTSGPDSNPIARGSPQNTQTSVRHVAPSNVAAAKAEVHQSGLHGGGSGHMLGSSTRRSVLPAGSSQIARGHAESDTAAEESRVGVGAGDDAGKGGAGNGKERLPQQQELSGQPGAPKAQVHAAPLTEGSLQQVDHGSTAGGSLHHS